MLRLLPPLNMLGMLGPLQVAVKQISLLKKTKAGREAARSNLLSQIRLQMWQSWIALKKLEAGTSWCVSKQGTHVWQEYRGAWFGGHRASAARIGCGDLELQGA